jgi:hypothetical protein
LQSTALRAHLVSPVGGFSKANGWSEQKRTKRGASKSGQPDKEKALIGRGL